MVSTLPEAGFTLSTAARLIGCHPKSIYKIVKRGDLETFVDEGSGRLMVSREEVYSYIKRKETK